MTVKKPKLTLKDLANPEVKRKLALDEDANARRVLRDLGSLQEPQTIARPKDAGVYGSGLAFKPYANKGAKWMPLGQQWLKLISDTRPNRPHTLLRMELYDEAQQKRIAVFDRRKEW